jgi:formylglycine-generating enzyme required for sulfatase activity
MVMKWVVRGASWAHIAADCRAGYRRNFISGSSNDFLGLRCARGARRIYYTMRGGWWHGEAEYARASYRNGGYARTSHVALGLRCARGTRA